MTHTSLLTKLIVAFAFFAILRLAQAGVLSPNGLPDEAKEYYRSFVISMQEQITNMAVTFQVEERASGSRQYHKYNKVQWARSGQKQFRKSWWPNHVGEPQSERWGIAVWDGEYLKAYDSKIDNGSVRPEYDPQNAEHPPVWTSYNKVLGHLSRGSLAELLSNIELEYWQVEWAVPEKQIVFRTNHVDGELNPRSRHSWTVDLERGGMIVCYDIEHRKMTEEGKWGEFGPYSKWEVEEGREVEPGIWLPVVAKAVFQRSLSEGEGFTLEKKLVVTEIQVNKPEIEEMFHFEFPKGSMYYDFTLGSSMVAGVDLAAFKDLVEMGAEELRTIASEGGKPEETRESDLEIADRLVDSLPVDSKAGPHELSQTDRSQRLYGVFGAVLAALFSGGAFAFRFRSGARRKQNVSQTE
jgi:hypothetical protein